MYPVKCSFFAPGSSSANFSIYLSKLLQLQTWAGVECNCMDMGTSYKSNISIANSLEYNKTKPKPETLKFEKKHERGDETF